MPFLYWLAGLPRQAALLCIRAYQATAPMRPRMCRYHPSCSEYTAQSILKYGLFTGAAFGIRRISKIKKKQKIEKKLTKE